MKTMEQKNNIEYSKSIECIKNEYSLYDRNRTRTGFSINNEINKLMKELYEKRVGELKDKENVRI